MIASLLLQAKPGETSRKEWLLGAPSPRFPSSLSLCRRLSALPLQVYALSSASKFEAELKAEQEERKREEEKRRLRQAAFRELKAAFST